VGPRGVIISDVDGTLCFHQEAHGVRVIDRLPDGRLLVEADGGRHLAHDVSTSSYQIYLAEETRRLMHALRAHHDIVLVTGGRRSTVEARRAVLDFADAVIIESGGAILDNGLRSDEGWFQRLAPERACLDDVARALEREGWRLDCAGRVSGIRVRLRDNPDRSADDFQALCRDLPLPPALVKTINLENLDIILRSAGKANAVAHWLGQRGRDPADAIGIGDDVNDIEFLRLVGRPFVLASAYPSLLDEARRQGWRISRRPHFDGIHEILGALLAA
jgi:hydroxymethylpyrimidine pyrophosphatase-like HAD family hydrolase